MNLNHLFPVLKDATYLNTANSGILSKPLLEWRNSHDLDFYNHGSEFRLYQAEFLQGVKDTVARFFNTKVNNTFLVPNFSFGFNTFLEGISPSNRFLLLDEDYPSVNYPVRSRGFAFEVLPSDQHLEAQILERIHTFKPTVFVFSVVQYINGNKISQEFISKIKALYPDLLLVADGTQYCGTEPLDFEQSGLDVLMCSGYKWMLAGYGNGFMLLKDRVKELLYPEAQKIALPKEPFLKDKQFLSMYFEAGHQDTLAFGTLKESILFMEQLGVDLIKDQISTLAVKAKESFAERGLLDPSVVIRKKHSSIFNLNIEHKLYEKLREEQVICSPRGNGIRVAFHFYNTPQDLDRILEVIDNNR
ncbi:aminotransferase class V-fold PLP-dependent enzyme [Pedobacter metabolipauper]|uniref:Selenocysteine lyase/cysteine desulfurase n=1 Tax=Pedobacter metabolipauper TaxID=425513 RepID=A0A4R6T2D9_9SPHI|nr:aminotransferase class V-fold PLP-dependent enzyme [Pedobacter metabolipauper]TDQ11868.1 selenocysteine lyase/cysteine desulfurase [Pedobacter metabolipauper]